MTKAAAKWNKLQHSNYILRSQYLLIR